MLIRHEPWNLISDLNSIFESALKRNSDDSNVESGRWIPAVDIKETKESFLFYVDIPGVDPAKIDISMENAVLTIKGVREEVSPELQETFFRLERLKGEFHRRFTLPDTADAEQISAKTKQGVLQIVIGKKKIAQARKIAVELEE